MDDGITCETILISTERQDAYGHQPMHYLFPIVIGRSSVPVPAHDSSLPLSCDDYFRLKASYLSFSNISYGKSGAHFMCLERSKAARAVCLDVQRASLIKSAFNPPDDKSGHLSPTISQFYSYTSSCDTGVKFLLFSLFVSLKSVGAPSTHPLVSYLDRYLIDSEKRASRYIMNYMLHYAVLTMGFW